MKVEQVLTEEFQTKSANAWFKKIITQYHDTGNTEDEEVVKQINIWRDKGQDFKMQRAYFSLNREGKKGFDDRGRPKVRKKRTRQKIHNKTAHQNLEKSDWQKITPIKKRGLLYKLKKFSKEMVG